MFGQLCQDEMPMVRRAAVTHLAVWSSCSSRICLYFLPFALEICKMFDEGTCYFIRPPSSFFVSSRRSGLLGFGSIFGSVINRRQDSVRLLTVEFAVSLASMLTPEECSSLLSQHLRTMVADKSWRVRYMVSEHFAMVRSMHSTFAPLLDFR